MAGVPVGTMIGNAASGALKYAGTGVRNAAHIARNAANNIEVGFADKLDPSGETYGNMASRYAGNVASGASTVLDAATTAGKYAGKGLSYLNPLNYFSGGEEELNGGSKRRNRVLKKRKKPATKKKKSTDPRRAVPKRKASTKKGKGKK